ncbi:MAG: hypothetical protein HC880_12585 [Bacteroidia bacterium]|nr:hypothetical protein [Bacteroidia bacterium]
MDHKANLNHSVIGELVKVFGIIANDIKNEITFKKFIEDTYGITKIANTDDNIIFGKLKDLAQRRNDVSHGATGIELLSNEISLGYIEFVKQYAKALYQVFLKQLIKYKIKHKSEPIILVGKKVINNLIICASVEDRIIEKGDKILIETSEEYYQSRNIESIEINKEAKPRVEVTVKTDVGLKVSDGEPKIKKTHKFYFEKN